MCDIKEYSMPNKFSDRVVERFNQNNTGHMSIVYSASPRNRNPVNKKRFEIWPSVSLKNRRSLREGPGKTPKARVRPSVLRPLLT